jgi:wyosine [tRNA(Phe)-imidazoG37] synthetase (radical SAM superfamily)
MVKRLPELLAAAKSLQMQVVLSTNGTLVQRRHADILPLLDWIALPLDGHDAATHETARPGKVASFWRVIESISFIRESYPEVKIKLGTVVSKLNVDAVAGIPATVARDAYSPDIWKIYQTSYSNYGADNREDLHLSNDEFEKVVGEALASAAEFAWSTIVYRNSERSGKYLFIEPSGDAMVIVDSQEMVIGNFLDDFNDAVGRWSVYVSNELLASNVVNTYF